MNPAPHAISKARRWAYRASAAISLLVMAAFGARTVGAWRRDAVERAARAESRPSALGRIPVPGETLHAHCEAKGDYCAQTYGPQVELCLRQDCESPKSGFTTTPQGFVGPRGRIYDEQAPPGTIRLLALGGSTTGGVPWDRAWPAHLERLLNARAALEWPGTRIEVLNLGMAAAGSRESLRLYEALGARFSPQLIILGEEVNDLGGCAPFESPGEARGGASALDTVRRFFADEAEPEALAVLSPWFARHRAAFESARSERRLRVGIEAARGALLGDGAGTRSASPREAMRVCLDTRGEPEAAAPSIFDDFDDGFAWTRAHYDALLDLARRDGVASVVLSTVPHDFEDSVCPSPACAPLLTLHDWRRYVTRLHNPSLREYGERRGLVVVDLEEGFERFTHHGERFAGVPASAILERFAMNEGLSAVELETRFRAGRVGKAPLFAWEWMHPSDDGHRLIAAIYVDRLWPVLAEMRPASPR